MARETGSGVTPRRVAELLKKECLEKNTLTVSKATNIGFAAIARYIKGIGEPTTKTLEKLSAYFKVSTPWLRGEGERSLEQERWFYNWERLSPEERAEIYVSRGINSALWNKALVTATVKLGERLSILAEKYGESYYEPFMRLQPDERKEVIEYLTLMKDVFAAGEKLGTNKVFMGNPKKDE